MRPNSESQIARLKECVSWIQNYNYYYCISNIADGWKPGSLPYKFNYFILTTDTSKRIEAVFCKAAEIDEIATEINSWTSTVQRYPIWLVIEDYINERDIEAFLYGENKRVTPFFLDVNSAIAYGEIVNRILDGIDWGRSLNSGNLTFEWD